VATTFDVIVVGLGAMGSATAYHLARRGCSVLGLDRFTPPHTSGSSHGQSRIIREAYFEHPVYVPMVQRAYALWQQLEQDAGCQLFRQTGGLMIGRPDSSVVRGARLSAETHHLPHELLSAHEIRDRFPALCPEPEMVGVLELRAGILFPERCISAHLDLARKHGAVLRFNEAVQTWSATDETVNVRSARGEVHARQLVLSAGSWINTLLPGLALPFRIERQVLYWFEPRQSPAVFDPGRCPIHLWQFDGRHFFYGFPDLGEGVKVARHHEGEFTTPDDVRREVSAAETETMRDVVRRFLPAAAGRLRSATVCLYTDTPDEHFWIDWHPRHRQVLIASPCSGHGFKFSSVVGEIVADLLMKGKSQFDLSLFRNR
jgi:sarcosine oxidase